MFLDGIDSLMFTIEAKIRTFESISEVTFRYTYLIQQETCMFNAARR